MLLDAAIERALPANYNFEIKKTLTRIASENAKHVALQFPEGLLIFATQIADILRRFANLSPDDNRNEEGENCQTKADSGGRREEISISILGDVAYGACCVDDLMCQSLGVDLLVHYGHSCLVPLSETVIPCLYVFVDIFFDPSHLAASITANFSPRPALCDSSETHTAATDITSTSAVPNFPNAEEQRSLNGSGAAKNTDNLVISDSNSVDTARTNTSETRTIALMGTIQYATALHTAAQMLQRERQRQQTAAPNINLTVPQVHPLSPGEVLGCTSPILDTAALRSRTAAGPAAAVTNSGCSSGTGCGGASTGDTCGSTGGRAVVVGEEGRPFDLCVFVADGRFHLESAMIQNPELPFYRYDPFLKVLTREHYDMVQFFDNRRAAIKTARSAETVALVLGTLGRQGSVGIVERIEAMLRKRGVGVVHLLLSELMPHRLKRMSSWCGAFIQVACPRLSIDWGHFFERPVLNSYESFVAFGDETFHDVYPMDFYARADSPWTNYYKNDRVGSLRNSPTAGRGRAAIIKARLEAERRKERKVAAEMMSSSSTRPLTTHAVAATPC